MKRWPVILVLALGLILAGCGGADEEATVSTPKSSSSQTAVAPPTPTSAVAPPTPTKDVSEKVVSVVCESSKITGTGGTEMKQYSSPPPMTIDKTKSYTAKMETSEGTISIELLAKVAPKTVNNFVFLACEGFYNDVKFHRIVKGFMVQSGDPTGTGSGGPGYRFEDEPVTRDYVVGTVAMANAGPNTNGSQFFIMHGNSSLPKAYTIFGQVKAGQEVVDKIANTPVTRSTSGELSKPTREVTIKSITVETK